MRLMSLFLWRVCTIGRKGKYKHLCRYIPEHLTQVWQVGHPGRLPQGRAADLRHEDSVTAKQERLGDEMAVLGRETILLNVLSLRGVGVSRK